MPFAYRPYKITVGSTEAFFLHLFSSEIVLTPSFSLFFLPLFNYFSNFLFFFHSHLSFSPRCRCHAHTHTTRMLPNQLSPSEVEHPTSLEPHCSRSVYRLMCLSHVTSAQHQYICEYLFTFSLFLIEALRTTLSLSLGVFEIVSALHAFRSIFLIFSAFSFSFLGSFSLHLGMI
jgi:hypothetical protein